MSKKAKKKRGAIMISKLWTYDEFLLGLQTGQVKKQDAPEIIKSLINWLILSLYELDEETILRVNSRKLKKLHLDEEAINWGDVGCVEVKGKDEGIYIAYVEEASPDAMIFREWIEQWLERWGWHVCVITNW